MDSAEALIAARSDVAGIGLGLYADYAGAHLMYLSRGYRPDGRGLAYRGVTINPGASVLVDDDLVLMMTRTLRDRDTGDCPRRAAGPSALSGVDPSAAAPVRG
jgi:hypothetical protein